MPKLNESFPALIEVGGRWLAVQLQRSKLSDFFAWDQTFESPVHALLARHGCGPTTVELVQVIQTSGITLTDLLHLDPATTLAWIERRCEQERKYAPGDDERYDALRALQKDLETHIVESNHHRLAYIAISSVLADIGRQRQPIQEELRLVKPA